MTVLKFTASWGVPIHDGGSQITGYELVAQKSGSGVITDICWTKELTCSVQIASGFEYLVLVTAINSAGKSWPVVPGYVSWKKPNATTTTVPPAKLTITCVKGKVTKKVTADSPVCPAGYKKK